MRAFRLALAGTVASVALSAATATAAPPVGCYGLPDVPSAFVCVVSFTPGGAVPSAGTEGDYLVTVPRFCAGDCYGPIPLTVPKPYVRPGTGSVAVVTYNGRTYVIAVGQTPPPPPVEVPPVQVPPVDVPPLPDSGYCPGSRPVHAALGALQPYVCVRSGTGSYEGTSFFVGTCATPECTVVEVPTQALAEAVVRVAGETLETVRNLLDVWNCPVQADIC